MKISQIKESISKGKISIELKAVLDQLIPEYAGALSKTGSSVEIVATSDVEFDVDISVVKSLCQFFIDGEISELELAYIADALQLTDSVEFIESSVADLIAELTDPEINGVFTKERALKIVQSRT